MDRETKLFVFAGLLVILAMAMMVQCAGAASAFTFQPHKEAYAIAYGSEGGQTQDQHQPWIKFQYSTKVPMTKEGLGIPYIPDGRVYLGYTQASWWSLYDSSATFVETNYNPELFYEVELKRFGRWLDQVRVGYEHVSTGEGGDRSQGWDRIVAELRAPLLSFLTVSVKPYGIINTEPNTYGVRDLVTFFGQDFGASAKVELDTPAGHYAIDFTRDSFDADVMLHLQETWNFLVYAQFHNGTMENLTEWGTDRKSGGAGIAFKW